MEKTLISIYNLVFPQKEFESNYDISFFDLITGIYEVWRCPKVLECSYFIQRSQQIYNKYSISQAVSLSSTYQIVLSKDLKNDYNLQIEKNIYNRYHIFVLEKNLSCNYRIHCDRFLNQIKKIRNYFFHMVRLT